MTNNNMGQEKFNIFASFQKQPPEVFYEKSVLKIKKFINYKSKAGRP